MAQPAAPGGQARMFFGLGLAVLMGFSAYVGRSVLIPFVVAGFLCFLIFTLKESVTRIPFVGKFCPAWLGYLIAFGVIISGFILFAEIIKTNVEALVSAAPLYETRLRELTQAALHRLEGLAFLPEDLVGGVDQLRRAGLSMINPLLAEIGGSARALTSNFVTIFLYTAFMIVERGRIFKKIDTLSRDDNDRRAVNGVIADIGSMVRQYITVKTVSNLVTAGVSYVILKLVGVDFAGFWALLIFLLNFIPIIGAISAITLPVILALIQPEGGGLKTALIALGLLVAAEQTMSSVIEPRLIGRSLNLSPLVVLLSLAVWGSLWGFAGLLLSVPITVTVMIILTQFPSTRPIAILLSDTGRIAEIRHPRVAAQTADAG